MYPTEEPCSGSQFVHPGLLYLPEAKDLTACTTYTTILHCFTLGRWNCMLVDLHSLFAPADALAKSH